MGGYDPEFLLDLFAGIAPVSVRKMFGGKGVFKDGLMIALVTDDTLYLKSDAQTAADFDAESAPAFTYSKPKLQTTTTINSLRRLPDQCFDDPDEMVRWAHLAVGAARRSAQAKPAKGNRSKKAR